jgi:hypothetical protein
MPERNINSNYHLWLLAKQIILYGEFLRDSYEMPMLKKYQWPGMLVHVYNPSNLAGEGRRTVVQTGIRKSMRPYLKNKLKAKNGVGVWIKW